MAPTKAEGALRYRSPHPVPIILLRSVCGLLRSTKTAALEADIVFSDTSTRGAIFSTQPWILLYVWNSYIAAAVFHLEHRLICARSGG